MNKCAWFCDKWCYFCYYYYNENAIGVNESLCDCFLFLCLLFWFKEHLQWMSICLTFSRTFSLYLPYPRDPLLDRIRSYCEQMLSSVNITSLFREIENEDDQEMPRSKQTSHRSKGTTHKRRHMITKRYKLRFRPDRQKIYELKDRSTTLELSALLKITFWQGR